MFFGVPSCGNLSHGKLSLRQNVPRQNVPRQKVPRRKILEPWYILYRTVLQNDLSCQYINTIRNLGPTFMVDRAIRKPVQIICMFLSLINLSLSYVTCIGPKVMADWAACLLGETLCWLIIVTHKKFPGSQARTGNRFFLHCGDCGIRYKNDVNEA